MTDLDAIEKRARETAPSCGGTAMLLAADVLALVRIARAASTYLKAEGGHPYTGACVTSHYVGRECDCGFNALVAALAALAKREAP